MYSRKSVDPRMEPWGTPPLTGYSCEDLPSRTTQSRLLLRKEEISLNVWLAIPSDLKVSEEDQHPKPCQKPWIYQVSQLE